MSILKYFRQHHVNHTLHEQGRNKTLRDFPLSSFGLDLKACFQNGLVGPAMVSENFDYQWVNYCLSLDCVSVSNQTIHKGSWSTYKDREPGLHRVYRTSHVNCFYARVCVCGGVWVWSVNQSHVTFCDLMTVAHRFLCPWNSPGKNTEVGYHFLLQRTFLSRD